MWLNGNSGIILLVRQYNNNYYWFSQIRRSIMLNSHLTTYIHKQFIISGIFFIISHRKDLEFFQVLNLKRKKSTKDSREERTLTEDHSLRNLRSIHCGLSASSRLQVEKSRSNHFEPDSHELPVLALQRSLCRGMTLSSRTFQVDDKSVVNELTFLG